MKANNDMTDKTVLVIGSGKSGIGSAHLLTQAGAKVILLDQDEKKTAESIEERLHAEDRGKVKIVIGVLSKDDQAEISLVVPSPAVPLDSPLMKELAAQNKEIISEIELACRFMKGGFIAITGTNGKTTTTTLTGELMKQMYDSVFVVGNIGEAFTEHALETTEESITVAEISSFQLEAVKTFHANVSALLNVTPDHLDRHHTMENYVECKERISNLQNPKDVCVLNYRDRYTYDFGMRRCPAHVLWFSSNEKPPEGFWLDGDKIIEVDNSGDREILSFSECLLKGRVGAENICAALCIAKGMGADVSKLADTVRKFKPVAHRIEYIATKKGVEYYNDSKATNPDAAIHGIEAMTKPTYLIGGGYDKGNAYDEWIEAFDGKVKKLVLIGQTAADIKACAEKHGFTDVVMKDTFDEALAYCTEQAVPGEAVLLSPACASWGMFPNYEVRGDMFRQYAEGLTE